MEMQLGSTFEDEEVHTYSTDEVVWEWWQLGGADWETASPAVVITSFYKDFHCNRFITIFNYYLELVTLGHVICQRMRP